MFSVKILCFLLEQSRKKSLKIVVIFPEISLVFHFASKIIEDYCISFATLL
jgi:hypothetical protein